MDGRPSWQVADVIELEERLAQDRQRDPAELSVRDERLVLEGRSRSERCWAWLQHCRRHDGHPTAGQQAVGFLSLLAWFGVVLSFLSGGAVSVGFLQYRGEALINVTAFFALTVGLQLAGLLATLTFLLWQRIRPTGNPGVLRLLRLEHYRLQVPLSSPLLRWRWFAILQAWGVAFNVGLVAFLLFRVTFYDLAFGWATSYNVQPDTIHGIVHSLAIPWRDWLTVAVPSLEQVESSRIRLAASNDVADPDGVSAWWKFLMMALVVYGLTPRLVLWVFGMIGEKRTLAGLRFDSAACESMLLRFRPAVIERENMPIACRETTRSVMETVKPADHAHLFIDRNQPLPCAAEDLPSLFSTSIHIAEDRPGNFLVFEAWRPPLEENLETIRTLRKLLGERGLIYVGLIGMVQESKMAPVQETDVAVWESVIRERLADPQVVLLQASAHGGGT